MARRFVYYDEGTPQRVLQDAVAARFGDNETFFRKIARSAGITVDSVWGSYYGFLAGRRSLAATQKALYCAELGVAPELLEAIDALRGPAATPKGRARLAELEAKVDALTVSLDASRRAHAALQKRVSALEPEKEKTTRSRQAASAKRPGRKTA